MENTMNSSEKFGELAGALAKAQINFLPVMKDTANPYFNSKYADLATVIGATQKALAENGLVVIQNPIVDTEAEKAGVNTVLAHSSGEWMSHELLLPATMKGKDGNPRFDAQSVGSAITYARRYSYQAIVGVAAEVDDDGNAAADGQRQSTGKQAQKSGEEVINITPYKEGFVALSGPGLPIVRANLDNKTLAALGWKWEGKTAMISAGKTFDFVDLCKKHNVGTVLMDAQTNASHTPMLASATSEASEPSEPSPLTKAVLPPFNGSGEPSQSTDPIILSADRIRSKKPGGKEFLKVNWGGKMSSCFDKKLFPHLEHYKGRPAMLILEQVGQYTNLVGIERLDGADFDSERV